jgi:hypothetical protein
LLKCLLLRRCINKGRRRSSQPLLMTCPPRCVSGNILCGHSSSHACQYRLHHSTSFCSRLFSVPNLITSQTVLPWPHPSSTPRLDSSSLTLQLCTRFSYPVPPSESLISSGSLSLSAGYSLLARSSHV